MKTFVLKSLIPCLAAFSLSLSGCDQLPQREERVRELTIILPNDFQGLFRVSPGSGPDVLPPIEKGQENVWEIPASGDAKVRSTKALADPYLQVTVRYEDGRELPNYNLGSPREAPPGVFKLYTETAGENYWMVGTVEERNRAWAMGTENLELGTPLSEVEEAKAELDPLEF
jgi:hypothetical protein